MQTDRRHCCAGLSLCLNPETGALIAEIDPDAATTPVDDAWLEEQLQTGGFGDLRFDPAARAVLLEHYNSGRALQGLTLAECVDARIVLDVAVDGMTASLTIEPAQGGRGVTQAEVLAELADHKITEGILLDAIDQAVAAGRADALLVAQGRTPQHGEDGRLESLLPVVRDRAPRVDETGHIDYRDFGEIFVVHAGDPLLRRRPPTPGIDGVNIFGTRLPAMAGKDIRFSPGLSGVETAADDPDLLVAAVSGQPIQVRDGMTVEPVFTVDQVDLGSGNIHFEGSVVVRGDVSVDMTIRASGDIQIGGVAEPCTLIAGGDITVKGGVLGSTSHKETAEHWVRCGGSFSAGYAQQAHIDAGDSIFIDDMAMQCELIATNHVKLGKRKRGAIVGGRVQAMLSISAKIIGSENRVLTRLEIGVDPAIQKEAMALAAARDEKETRLLEVSKLLAFSSAHPERTNAEMVERIRNTAAALSEEIRALREQEQAIEHKIELAHDARVHAEQKLHDGVEVWMGTQRFKVTGDHGPTRIGLTGSSLGVLPDENG